MKILFAGDVVAGHGCDYLLKTLPGLKRKHGIDFTVVNGENSATGNGITAVSAEMILSAGADIITTGNHVFKRPEFTDYLEKNYCPVIRPANFHPSAPGKGVEIISRGSRKLAVINLIGEVGIDGAYSSPFDAADKILASDELRGISCIFIDFHAEATSEKRALGMYLDGRVSAVCGTHTHVRTADARVLKNGTAYITDAGMTGVTDTVLGVSAGAVIKKLRTKLPVKFDTPAGDCSMGCVIIEIDEKTGRALSCEGFTV